MNKASVQQKNDIAQTLGMRKSGLRKWTVRTLTAGLVIAGTYLAFRFYAGKREAETTVHYETQPVSRGELTVTVSATGTLEPVNEVEVGSEVSGTMKTVEVGYNDRVKLGQVLARIDTSKLEAQVLQSESALEAAQAKVLEAEATLKESEAQLVRLNRVSMLSGGKVPSQYELEAQEAAVARARAGVASAKADVSQAQATLHVNQSDMEKAVIHSPVNGVVLMRAIEPGQTVAASFESPVLFKLAEDLKQLELHVDVDEADVGQVHEGLEASFTVDAYPDKHFPARITQVRYGATTTAGVVTYTTVLKVNNDDLTLRPGMTATAVITTRKLENALLVPSVALRFVPPQAQAADKEAGGGSLISSLLPHPPRTESKANDTSPTNKEQRVYVLLAGQLRSVPVTAGMTDGVLTEVASGMLEQGMGVVVEMTTGKR